MPRKNPHRDIRLTIPDDWAGELYHCIQIEWPNSQQWDAILLGLLHLMTRGRNWNEATGSVLDVQAIGREIFTRNKDFISCGAGMISDIRIVGCEVQFKRDGDWVVAGSLEECALGVFEDNFQDAFDVAVNLFVGSYDNTIYRIPDPDEFDKWCFAAQELAEDWCDAVHDIFMQALEQEGIIQYTVRCLAGWIPVLGQVIETIFDLIADQGEWIVEMARDPETLEWVTCYFYNSFRMHPELDANWHLDLDYVFDPDWTLQQGLNAIYTNMQTSKGAANLIAWEAQQWAKGNIENSDGTMELWKAKVSELGQHAVYFDERDCSECSQDSFDVQVPCNTPDGLTLPAPMLPLPHTGTASGTVVYGPGNMFADAYYRTEDNWVTHIKNPWWQHEGDNPDEYLFGATDLDYPEYNPTHEYTREWTPGGDGAMTIWYLDSLYEDNSGTLHVVIDLS